MNAIFRRLAWFLGRRRFESDLSEELHFHQEQAESDARAAGSGAEEARFEARRRLGSQAQIGEAARAIWSPPALADLLQDVRYALRGLRRRPGYAAAALVTLLLGIGATTALFSVLDAVLLRPLPYSDSGRLVQVWEHNLPRNRPENVVSPANFLDWRSRSRSFEELAAYTWANVTLVGDEPELLSGRAVTTNFFAALQARPMLGRLFAPEDTLPNAPVAMLLSHGLWVRRFGSDPSVVGKPTRIRESTALVIGVMPPDFRPMGDEVYWEPQPISENLRTRRGRYALVVGRLKPGVTLESANLEVRAIAASLESEYPVFNKGWTVDVVALQEQITGKARPVLLLLAGAMASVLLIACANVANLKLGQVLARQTELSVRAALGASRTRILRQMLVEGLVLAGIGGALGTLAAWLGVRALVHAQVRQIPRLAEVGVDLRVLGFALLVTALAGIAFGLAPALALREKALGLSLGRRGGAGGSAHQARRLRGALVSAQVALCLMLLAGAGLTARSLDKLLAVSPGFDPAGVVTMELNLPSNGYREPEKRLAFYEELKRRVSGLPEVRGAGLVSFLPLRGITPGTAVHLLGQPEPPPGQALMTEVNAVDDRYFETMRTPLLQGRPFTPADRLGAPRVVLVNQAFVRENLKNGSPIGQRIRVDMANPDTIVEIIGVVGDVRRERLDVDPRPSVYYPFLQEPTGYMTLVVRSAGEAEALIPALRREIAGMDRALPVLSAYTMESRLAVSTADRRYPMLLLVLLGGLALVLASVGLYGVLAYLVGQRSREIGVRRALGAPSGAIASLILGEGLRFVGVGVLVGLVAAFATTRFLGALLYGLSPTDPVTLGVASAILLAVGVLAAWAPARRAARVDPAVTLRENG